MFTASRADRTMAASERVAAALDAALDAEQLDTSAELVAIALILGRVIRRTGVSVDTAVGVVRKVAAATSATRTAAQRHAS